MPTIPRVAREAAEWFETATRENGSEYIRIRDGWPDWLHDLIRDAHDARFPDDERYRIIFETLNRIADQPDDYDRDDLEDARHELTEPDFMTADLTAWLHSSASRVWYLSDVIKDYGSDVDGFRALAIAQEREREEVFSSVLDSLAARVQAIEDEEPAST